MDRLPALILVLLLGCEESAVAPLPGRFDAVAATAAPKVAKVDEFCDVYKAASEARTFAYPELAEPAPTAGASWRWVNVWATWCAPCVGEMPMIEKWHDRLAASGHPIDVVYLSVDEDAAAVASFREQKHRGVGPRAKSLDTFAAWLPSIGLDATAAIPINLFLDPQGHVRCVRTGALEEHHYAAVAELVSGR